MCDGQVEGRTDAHTRLRTRLDRRANTQRVEYSPAAMIFAQGDPAASVMYVETGAVRLSILSHAGKRSRGRGA
jgi:CRP-like cAMP-binding protein